MLDRSRGPARVVDFARWPGSPLGTERHPACGGRESRRPIATGFATELSDHIISLDLLGREHREALRGARVRNAELRPQEAARPRRKPGTDRVRGGSKLIMTSGGYRSVSPRDTVARFPQARSARSPA
jgi:ribosomal protein S12 methylthiotransferase accessory factor